MTSPATGSVTVLPPLRRKRRRWGKLFARFVCFILAVIAVLPAGAAVVARSRWARSKATQYTADLVKAQGLTASYQVNLRIWPPTLILDHVRVSSTDGGAAALVAKRLSARPKLFALLAGKLRIDQIAADAPRVRIVYRDYKLTNLGIDIPRPDGTDRPWPQVFDVVSLTDAAFDLDIEGVSVVAEEIDLDVTSDEEVRGKGAAFEVAIQLARARVHTLLDWKPAPSPKGPPVAERVASWEDSICSVSGRVRIEKGVLKVRRFEARGAADLDPDDDTWVDCDVPSSDRRKIELALKSFHVEAPRNGERFPRAWGEISARAPIALAERLGGLPDTDGWISISGRIPSAPPGPEEEIPLPDVEHGKVRARNLRIDHYAFAREIESDFTIRKGVVESARTTVAIAEGLATLTDVKVEPKVKGIPIRAKIEAKGVSFTHLLRDLGVHKQPHVQWDLERVATLPGAELKGTLRPLRIDGDISATTTNFGVYAGPAEVQPRARIISLASANILTRVAVRPEAVEFQRVHLDLPHGQLDGGFVSLGYDNDLRVDIAHVKTDLGDITPLGSVAVGGVVEGEVHMGGMFGKPTLKADIGVENLVIADIPFGTVTTIHGDWQGGRVLDLTAAHVVKGKSTYELTTGRVDFTGPHVMKLDGVVASPGLGIKDLLSIFRMEKDPRFETIDGTIDTTATMRVVLGGPEDPCRAGRVDVSANTHVEHLTLYGEHFEDAHVDFDLRWIDRLAGLPGAELEVHGATLHKVHEPGKEPQGWVLASANLHRGGDLRGTVVLESLPLSKLDSLGPARTLVEGAVSGLFHVDGKIDAFRLQGDVDSTMVRIRHTPFGASHVRFGMTQKPAKEPPVGRSGCGAPVPPAFDKDAYLADTSSQGEYTLDGKLFDGQVTLSDVVATRQKAQRISGKVAFSRFDLSKISHALLPQHEAEDGRSEDAFGGELTGALSVDRLVVTDLAHASVRFAPRSLTLTRGKQNLVMKPTQDLVELENDTVVVPPLTFELAAPNGLKGAVLVHGTASRVTREAELLLSAELSPIDLGFLVGAVPRLTHANGRVAGSLRVKGRAKEPAIDGALQVRGAELSFQGLPSMISDIDLDVAANASEARVTRGTAKFAGGDVSMTGRMSLRPATFGTMEAGFALRDVHYSPGPGIAATMDADLRLTQNTAAQGSAGSRLPHLGGDVTITAAEYTRPTNIVPDIGGFRVGARRTAVDSYDPAQDTITIGPDLVVRARAPISIHNNLVDVRLGIDPAGLQVSGTNQRVGLRGTLEALPAGRLHLFSNDFDIRRAVVRFDDPTRIDPHVDALAVTEYRRYSTTGQGSAPATSASVGAESGGLWRISLHAHGDADDLKVDMTSDPALSQEDIFLLLTVGLTRAELGQVQAGSVAATAAFEALGTASGADRAVKQALPVIDDFRFGSAYSPRTGRSEPQVTVGRRITDNVRASITTSLTEDRQIRTVIEWRLSRRTSVQASYDNLNTLSTSSIGNLGFNVQWRLEFE